MKRLFFALFFSFFSQAEDISHENNEYNECVVRVALYESYLTQECLRYVQRQENIQAESNVNSEECYRLRATAIVTQIEDCGNELENK